MVMYDEEHVALRNCCSDTEEQLVKEGLDPFPEADIVQEVNTRESTRWECDCYEQPLDLRSESYLESEPEETEDGSFGRRYRRYALDGFTIHKLGDGRFFSGSIPAR